MPLNCEQLMKLAIALTEALESVIYTYDKDVCVDDVYVETLRKVVLGSKELLGE